MALQEQFYREPGENETAFDLAEYAPKATIRTFRALERNSKIVAMRTKGVSSKEIARDHRISRRTVHRVIQNHPRALRLYDEFEVELGNRKPTPRVRYEPRTYYNSCPHCKTGAVELDSISETWNSLHCRNCGWEFGGHELEVVRPDRTIG